MSGRCKERVWNGQFSDYPCSRKDWKDGFCKQHHPDSVKKRREDADARYKAKMAAVAETQYQAKLAEDTALQDQQRWQREEIARLRLENERLREALTYDWDQLEACRESLREHMVEIKRLREAVEAYIRAKDSDGGGKGGFFPKPPTVAHQRRVHLAWQELNAALRREDV